MKSVMSLEMYKKLKLNDLNTSSIPHVVGALGESLGTRGGTKCEININGKIFYQTFIVKKTHNSRQRLFDPKLHRYFMDKIKYPPTNTKS